MAYMLVRHKVKDFSKWKPGFDSHGSIRKKFGQKEDICSAMQTNLM
jgi:hypothetical protein